MKKTKANTTDSKDWVVEVFSSPEGTSDYNYGRQALQFAAGKLSVINGIVESMIRKLEKAAPNYIFDIGWVYPEQSEADKVKLEYERSCVESFCKRYEFGLPHDCETLDLQDERRLGYMFTACINCLHDMVREFWEYDKVDLSIPEKRELAEFALNITAEFSYNE